MPTIWEKWGRSCRACFTGALGSGIVGGQGLDLRGSYRNRLDQDIGFAWHVPHERPYSPFPRGNLFTISISHIVIATLNTLGP